MRFPSLLLSSAALLVAACTVSPALGQTFAANTGPDPAIGAPPPRPVHIGVPAHRRSADEALLYGRVREGVYTVDGMVAKLKLNYDVNGVSFLYFFVPGVGTAVVSASADPDAVVAQATYKENELSFAVGDHRFRLTGVALASEKGSAPAHLYARLDRDAWHLTRQPMIGFGSATAMPYVWPGALAPQAASVQADDSHVGPPVPATLLPSVTPVIPVSAPMSVRPPALPPVALR